MPHLRNKYTVLVGKQHGEAGHRWKFSIKIDLMKQDMKMWTGIIKLRIRTGGELL
jgi:hypothetical protein